MLDWAKKYKKYKNGEISKEEYDQWRYTYPDVEMQHIKLNQDEFKFQMLFEETIQQDLGLEKNDDED